MFQVGDEIRYRENFVKGVVLETIQSAHLGEIVVWKSGEGHITHHTPSNLELLRPAL